MKSDHRSDWAVGVKNRDDLPGPSGRPRTAVEHPGTHWARYGHAILG